VRGVGIVLAATLAMWVMAAVALWIFAGPDRPAQTHALNIPVGTAAAVRLGGNPLELPADWTLRAGDTLVVENHDTTTHVIGPLQVRSGERQTLLLRSGLGPLVCSVHPANVLRIDVAPTRTSWSLTFVVAVLFGPALGLLTLVLLRVGRALDEPDELRT
jgi:hypothetical protein